MPTNRGNQDTSSSIPPGSVSTPTVTITVARRDAFTMSEADQRALVDKAAADLHLGRFVRDRRHMFVAAIVSLRDTELARDFIALLGVPLAELEREIDEEIKRREDDIRRCEAMP